MLELKIFDLQNNKTWIETFNSPFLLEKRQNKLKHSKKLKVLSNTKY